MKKLSASILSLALLFFGAIFFASPAQAGIPDAISYCQATGNGTYHVIKNAPLASLITKDGEFKQGGINQNDKVPPFAYDFGGSNSGNKEGLNWVENTDRIFLMNDCQPVTNTLNPPTMDVVNYTCTTSGEAVLNGVDRRVATTGPTLDNETKTFTATASLPDNTTYITYTWADGTIADKTLTTVMPNPTADDLWDEATGGCRTPDTGAGGISNFALMVGGGAMGAGLLLFGILSATGRRRNA